MGKGFQQITAIVVETKKIAHSAVTLTGKAFQ
jgi:hypothetical protein